MRLKLLKKEQQVKNKLSVEQNLFNETELFMLSQQIESNKVYHRKAYKNLFKKK